MSTYKEITPNQLPANVFSLIGRNWALLTAQRNASVNTMTISWGQFGIMWQRPVVVVGVRPQRYTKEFIDAADSFSLSFLGEEFREQLHYLGSVSGRDENKIENAKLTLAHRNGVPYFTQAHTVLTARKLLTQPMDPSGFTDEDLLASMYPQKDFHTLYYGEITAVLVRE